MAKPQSEVKVSFNPAFFKWDDGKNCKLGKWQMAVRIRPKWIYLTMLAAEKIKAAAPERQDGGYTVQIGFAQKALAIKPVWPDSPGYRCCHKKSGLIIRHADLLRQVAERLELPISLPAVWDEQSKMLVVKFPDPVNTSGRRKLNPRGVYNW